MRQAAGALHLERVEGSAASAALVGDAGDAELLVRPGGLRISNRAEASADYAIRVPAGVDRLLVRIGREPLREIAVRADGDVAVPVGRAEERR